jgi:hypothetical protein
MDTTHNTSQVRSTGTAESRIGFCSANAPVNIIVNPIIAVMIAPLSVMLSAFFIALI